jgi:hypothetical protein
VGPLEPVVVDVVALGLVVVEPLEGTVVVDAPTVPAPAAPVLGDAFGGSVLCDEPCELVLACVGLAPLPNALPISMPRTADATAATPSCHVCHERRSLMSSVPGSGTVEGSSQGGDPWTDEVGVFTA